MMILCAYCSTTATACKAAERPDINQGFVAGLASAEKCPARIVQLARSSSQTQCLCLGQRIKENEIFTRCLQSHRRSKGWLRNCKKKCGKGDGNKPYGHFPSAATNFHINFWVMIGAALTGRPASWYTMLLLLGQETGARPLEGSPHPWVSYLCPPPCTGQKLESRPTLRNLQDLLSPLFQRMESKMEESRHATELQANVSYIGEGLSNHSTQIELLGQHSQNTRVDVKLLNNSHTRNTDQLETHAQLLDAVQTKSGKINRRVKNLNNSISEKFDLLTGLSFQDLPVYIMGGVAITIAIWWSVLIWRALSLFACFISILLHHQR